MPVRTLNKWGRGSIPLLLVCAWTLMTSVQSQSSGLNLNQDCEMDSRDGTTEYLACTASSEALSQLDVAVAVDPVNSTCGLSPDQTRMIFSTLGYDIFGICDASNSSFAHPPDLMIDSHDRDNPTWWQSMSWYDYPVPLEVSVTLSLHHSYTLVDNVDITFASGRPKQMIIEKSNDGGVTWETLQYYSTDCQDDFSLPDISAGDVASATSVFCTSDFSGTLPYSDGVVVYGVEARLALLFSDSRLPSEQVAAYQNDVAFRSLLTMTDLRLRLLYPATDGLEITGQQLSLIKYYYAISNIETYLICNCNQHGRFCVASATDGVICDCFHNTMGQNCEECLPLYNNRPWRAGSFTPYPTGTANECERCLCNDHADSCVYNATLGYGVCQDCYHNTAGDFCEICVDGFYRNESRAMSHPDVCIDCNCEPLGTILNSTICAQFADNETSSPIGQCQCRENVTGRACDQCESGYYGLLVDPNPGNCKVCGCNVLGTVNATESCDQLSGQCDCKPSVDTRQCGRCREQYYGFPTDAEEECTFCDCDPGGARSLTCHEVTGRCDCRGFVIGRQCRDVQSGYYYPQLDHNRYDAWEANSSCDQQSDVPSSQFTGRGYLVCQFGDTIIFNGITAFSNQSERMMNFISVRYSYDSSAPWLMVALTVAVEGAIDPSLVCPYPSGDIIAELSLSLEAGVGVSFVSDDSFSFHRDCSYSVELQFDSPGNGANSISIDAVVLLPDPTLFTVYQLADAEERDFYDSCLMNFSSKAERSAALIPCQPFTYSLMLEVAGQALPCSCDPDGSLQTTCATYGGACLCKPGVGGQRCDQCLPGFFNFTADGCQACGCNSEGSVTLACDFQTGQCPCKEGVALMGQLNSLGMESSRQCSVCLRGFYGFGGEEGCLDCGCLEEGSLSPQCNEEGVCSCMETVGGEKCDRCLDGFFNLTVSGCSECNCNLAGSLAVSCDPILGVCSCKTSVQGTKCDQCAPGSFNLAVSNPTGCQPCFCYGHGTVCNAAPNYIQDYITSDFTDGSSSGWRSSEASSLDVNAANIRVSHPPFLPSGESIYFFAPSSYLGFKLSSYGQTFSYSAKLDIGTVDLSVGQYLIMTGGPQNTSIYYTDEAFVPSLQTATFTATFYESLWREVEGGSEISDQDFLAILADVTSIQIRASFGAGTASTFYSVSMATATYDANPAAEAVTTTNVEQCVCDISSNTMGLSCDMCLARTKRQNPFGPPTEPCVPCYCNGRSSSCDPDSGVCIDCPLGTVGDLCESCAANVLEPACDSCIPDYYGFGTDLFGGGCEACNCNTTGTGGATQCDNNSGQCPCVGNFGGRLCDGCAYNYYNYELGCLKCDVCYDGIETAHLELQISVANLSAFVRFLEDRDNSSIPAPFYERLQETNSELAQLLDATSAAVQDGANLQSTIVALNMVVESLMEALDSVEEMITTAQENATRAEENARVAMETVELVNQELTEAYGVLTSGAFQVAQSILEDLRDSLAEQAVQIEEVRGQTASDVSSLEQQVSEIRNITQDTMDAASEALQTAQSAQVVHDNTTSRTAAEVVRATSVEQLGQITVQEVTDLASRAREVDSAARRKLADVEATQSAVDESRIDGIIQQAAEKTAEAGNVQASAENRISSAQSIVNTVNGAVSQTAQTRQEVDATIQEVNDRRDRSAAANEGAANALLLSQDAFDAAEEMLAIATDFDNRVDESQRAAFSALDGADAIRQEANNDLAQSGQLRAQLTPVAAAAQEGLSVASQAYSIADSERQAVQPINERAEELSVEAANGLTEADQITASVNALNDQMIVPSLAACNAFQSDIDALEAAVSMATESNRVSSSAVTDSQTRVSNLMQILASIQQVDTSQLPDLQVRIQQARALLTQRDYAAIVTSLQQGIEEQSAWLAETQATITSLQEQLDGLESFNVGP
ncbi:laminin subunit alpha-2-like [Diadema antillarum]|uniref:laminin subunit alpha-2-like n=1 Tax=Diadema antillarum TaxID=105358 RepID=UPI003A8819A4